MQGFQHQKQGSNAEPEGGFRLKLDASGFRNIHILEEDVGVHHGKFIVGRFRNQCLNSVCMGRLEDTCSVS